MGLPEAASRLAGQLSTAVLQGAARIMGALPRVLLACGTTVLAVFFTLSAYPEVMAFFRRQLGSELDRARGVKASVFATLWKWLMAECILLAVTFCQLLVGLLLIRQEYALLLAVLIALIDALPVFGTGTILIPWALALFLRGETKTGKGIVILYGAAALSRQALEPRLVGKQVGLNPVLTLLALYTGYRLLGVGGMIVFPIAAMLFKQLWDHSGLQPDG